MALIHSFTFLQFYPPFLIINFICACLNIKLNFIFFLNYDIILSYKVGLNPKYIIIYLLKNIVGHYCHIFEKRTMRKKFLTKIITKQRLQEIGIPVFFNFQEKIISNQIKEKAEKIGINEISSNEHINILYDELKDLYVKQHNREKAFLEKCGFSPLGNEMFKNYQKEYDKEEIENEFYLLVSFLRDDSNVSLFYTTKRRRGNDNSEEKLGNLDEESKLDGRNYNSRIYREILSNEKERINISKFINMLEQHILANNSSKIENEEITEITISRYKLLTIFLMVVINKEILKELFQESNMTSEKIDENIKYFCSNLLNSIIEDIIELKKEKNDFSINYLDKKILYLDTLIYTLIIFDKENLQKIISLFSNKELKKLLLDSIEIIQKRIIEKSNDIDPKKIFEKRKMEYEKKYHVKYKKFNYEDFYKITNNVSSINNNQQNISEKYINKDLEPNIEDYQEWLLIEKYPENILIQYLTKSLIIFLKKQMLKNNLEYDFIKLEKIKKSDSKIEKLKSKLKKELKNITNIEKNEELCILKSEIFKDKIKSIEINENTKGQIIEEVIYKLSSPYDRNNDYKDDVKEYRKILENFYLELFEYVNFEKVKELKNEHLKLFYDILDKELSFEAFNYILDVLIQEILKLSGRVKIEKN